MDEDRKAQLLRILADEWKARHDSAFVPGKTKVQYSGGILDQTEVMAVTDAMLDGWLGMGRRAAKFEKRFAGIVGSKNSLLVNSGSSANLLAMSVLVSNDFRRKMRPGDEVVTPATTFPTSLNPIFQVGLSPVLVDVDIGTYNPTAEALKKATSTKTRAFFLPHALGNPNEMDAVMEFADKKGIMVVEDACDALGGTYGGKQLGSFGLMGSFSFYPAHHITLGEGGALVSDDEDALIIARSLRDWGRACVCAPCKITMNPDAKCAMRYDYEDDTFPADYDMRYIYTRLGYNLKVTEIQAALGLAQLDRLEDVVKVRKRNFHFLYDLFAPYDKWFALPTWSDKADPSWFAFPLTIRKKAPFNRSKLVKWYEGNNIETRMMFAGNVMRQPAYKGLKMRIAGKLDNSETIMHSTFFLGVYPGLDSERLEYVSESTLEFLKRKR